MVIGWLLVLISWLFYVDIHPLISSEHERWSCSSR